MPPTTIVIRSKFFSTTDEPPYVEDIPPPNKSDNPEPLPLCSNTKIIINMLDRTKMIERAKFIYSPSTLDKISEQRILSLGVNP